MGNIETLLALAPAAGEKVGTKVKRDRLRGAISARLVILVWSLLAVAACVILVALQRTLSLRKGQGAARLKTGPALNWWYCRGFVRALRLTVRGIVPLAALERPHLLVANHRSWLDVFVLGCGGPFVFVAKESLRDHPVIGFMLDALGTIWVSEHGGSVPVTVAKMREAFQAGRSVVLFPEGGIVQTDSVAPFRPALFEAAREFGAPILPIALRYESGAAEDAAYRSVHWTDEATLLRHAVHAMQAIDAGVAAEVRLGRPLSPWFKSRTKLAAESHLECMTMLGETAPSRASQFRATPKGRPMRPSLMAALTALCASGVIDEPPDADWTEETPLRELGLDSLAWATLLEELHRRGHTIRTPACGVATLGALVEDDPIASDRAFEQQRIRVEAAPRGASCADVGELRYRVYVEEFGKPYTGLASHLTRTLIDPLDRTGVNVRAYVGAALVAAVRLNWAEDDTAWESFERVVGLSHANQRADMVFVSRLVVAHDYRHDVRVLGSLLAFATANAVAAGKSIAVAHCRASVSDTFKKIGFRGFGMPFFDAHSECWQHPVWMVLSDSRLPLSGHSPSFSDAPTRSCHGDWNRA